MELEWRPLVRADADAMAGLNSAVCAADRAGELRGVHEMERSFDDDWRVASPVRFGAFDGGELVGFGVLFPRVSVQSEHRMLFWGMVHPEYRRLGIGTELVRRGLNSAPELHARSFPGTKGFVLLELPDVAGTAELAQACGFKAEKHSFTMARLLPPDPAEVDIGIDVSGHALKFLRFDSQYIEQLRELHNDSFVPDHPGASEVPVEAWARRFSDPTFADDLSFLMIATGTHEVVGYVLSNADQGRDDRVGGRDVRLSTITTRRGYRRRGVATAMIGLVLAEAVTLGYGRATLDVDTANPSGALRVYERAGFAVVDSATSYARELL